ncbi:MAG TPA: hypothetical protein VNX47_01310 [Nevskia sp.]|jgi:hypothetical protein|nr:hypothetical protein [Nevskia sp.]
MRKAALAALFSLLALPWSAGASQEPLVDPPAITIPANIPKAAAANAIKQGLDARRWQVDKEQPGLVRATVRASGNVQATVDVSYDAQKIQIRYVASQNLDQRGSGEQRTIGSRYINWSRNLSLSITQALLQQPISR